MGNARRLALLLLVLLVTGPAIAGAEADLARKAFLARLASDPADPEALLGMADLHEAAGRRRHARRYLRAFVSLVYRHPRRVEAATRLAALRPAQPFDLEEDWDGRRIYRNSIDGTRAVLVPAGPYRRHLVVNGARVTVEIDLPAYLIDLSETPVGVYRRFLREGGYEAPQYWGEDGLAWLRHENEERFPSWVSVRFGFSDGAYPMWGPTFYEARAVARWAGKRIPTEAEWEKAARGGLELPDGEEMRPNPRPDRRFPWGDEPPEGPDGTYRANLDCVVPAIDPNGDDRALPVDSLPEGASPYGCLHMAGNVTEWNADAWLSDEERFTLPREAPFAREPREADADGSARSVRGGYFKQGDVVASIDYRDRRTFRSTDMCLLFKAGLRSAADAPDEDEEFDTGPLEDEPDPLDAERMHETALRALEAGDRPRAFRFARAALRLAPAGPIRVKLLDLVRELRPMRLWVKEGKGRFRNLIDGKAAVRSKGLLVDVHEVTEGDLVLFAAEGGYEIDAYWSAEGRAWRESGGPDGAGVVAYRFGAGDRPATEVTYWEAEAYAAWAGKRLPTADEWRKIAGRGKRKFPWGDDAPTPYRRRLASAETAPDVSHSLIDDRPPVGSFPDGASPDGVMDLFGSVAEWVSPPADRRWPDEPGLFGGSVTDTWRKILKDPESAFAPDTWDWNYRPGFRCVAPRPGRAGK